MDSPDKNTGVGCRFLLQGSSWPSNQTHISSVSCITGRFFTCWAFNVNKSLISRSSEIIEPWEIVLWQWHLKRIRHTFKSKRKFGSVQFTQSCLTLCDPMNCSMPRLPVHHQLPEFTQTHVHWVSDAIQPSHPLLSPSPPALNLCQHQSLLQWISSSH